jgi:hypothetical protein
MILQPMLLAALLGGHCPPRLLGATRGARAGRALAAAERGVLRRPANLEPGDSAGFGTSATSVAQPPGQPNPTAPLSRLSVVSRCLHVRYKTLLLPNEPNFPSTRAWVAGSPQPATCNLPVPKCFSRLPLHRLENAILPNEPNFPSSRVWAAGFPQPTTCTQPVPSSPPPKRHFAKRSQLDVLIIIAIYLPSITYDHYLPFTSKHQRLETSRHRVGCMGLPKRRTGPTSA